MSNNTLTAKKLKFFCFGTNTDEKMLSVLLNGFDFDDIYVSYFSKIDYNNSENITLIEKFITGIGSCADVFDKKINNIAASLMLQPYLYVDFPNELKTIKDLVEFYIFTGERIYEMTNNTKGIVVPDISRIID